MIRPLLLMPMLIGVTLSAQVPTPPTPPTAPAPKQAPMPPTPKAWSDISPSLNLDIESKLNLDYAYAFDKANEAMDRANYDLDRINDSYDKMDYAFANSFGGGVSISGWGGGPVAWAQNDPADSLYRQARDQFNRGDYRKAAELFKSLPQKYTTSVYIPDAQYYQAFALYRIGGTPELQEALAVLEARKPTENEGTRPPRAGTVSAANAARAAAAAGTSVGVGAGTNGRRTITNTYDVDRNSLNMVRFAGAGRGETDAAGLAARIANVLSSRGLSNDPAVKRALAAGGNSCDQDDQSVKAEALSALMQNDPETGRQMAVKILANKDECSVQLRRNAVMLVGNKADDAAASTLIPVAKSDPSPMVRMAALEYLARVQSDAAVGAVIEISHSTDDTQVQRAAIRALAQSSNPRARAEVRALVESSTADETLRSSVIDGIDRDHMTADDAAWLRSLYPKTTSARIKERIVSAIARAGGDVNNQWLLALVRNDDESLDARTTALERVGRTMDIATLVKMYDASSQGPIRRSVMDLLSERKEPEALDKIVDIAKHGTDVEMRRHAINILARSKDPRAAQLLLSLVDH